jgi:Trk K+ transport system NAD-binding subunit
MSDTHSPPGTSSHTPRNRRATRFERLRSRRRLSFRRWLLAHMYDILCLLREARVPLIGFLVVMASGVFYWMHIYQGTDYTPGQALFETMRMLALEHSEKFPHDLPGQLLFFAVPIFGLGFVFQGVLDFGRLLLDKSNRMEDWQDSLARTYHNHVIICGLGSVSYRVAMELLESGYDVVVIEEDWDAEFVRDALMLKVPVIHGDALYERVLLRAGIMRAHSLVAAISDDLLNIKIALEAQRVRPDLHVVLRVFNEELDHNLERSQFGPNTVFSSSALAAPTLAAGAVCRGIMYALPLPDVLLGISEVQVTPGGYLDSRIDLIEERFNVQVIGYRSQNARRPAATDVWQHHISPDMRLYGGDSVLLLGTLYALGEAWQHGQTCNQIMATLNCDIQQHVTPQYNTVIVCGLGTVGSRVVKELHRLDPRPEIVVICDTLTRDTFMEEMQELDVTIIQGDARTREVLYAAGIERAYSVVAVTANKLINVQICLTARHIRSDIDLVLRVFSDVLAEQLEGMFGIHTTYSISELGAITLAAASVVKGTSYAIDIGDQLMSTGRIEVQPGDGFAGQTIAAIREQHGMVVVALQRDERRFLLPHDPDAPGSLFVAPLQPGDIITVLAEIHVIARLQRQDGAESEAKAAGVRQLAYPYTDIPTATWPGKRASSVAPAPPPVELPPEPAEPAAEPAAPAPASDEPPRAAASGDVPLTEIFSHDWLEQLQRTEAAPAAPAGAAASRNGQHHAED